MTPRSMLRTAALAATLAAALPAVMRATMPAGAQSPAPTGRWEGAVAREGRTWRVAVTLARAAGARDTAFVDFLDLDTYGRGFRVVRGAERLRLERPQPDGRAIVFDGVVRGGEWTGTWTGLGIAAPFRLARAEREPTPLRHEAVAFANGDARLAGTLVLPAGRGPHPAVVITHGGAPETRETWLPLATRFARAGVAALAYDKRGVGASTGGPWDEAGLRALAGDALAGVAALRARADVDPARVGVAGHSQGGWIAPIAADSVADVAFVVVSAASAIPADRQTHFHVASMLRQAGWGSAVVARAVALWRRIHASAADSAARAAVMRDVAAVRGEPWFAASRLPPADLPLPGPGVRELLGFDPLPTWARVRVPVLAVWGALDTTVPPEHSRDAIARALSSGGNLHVTTHLLPRAEHDLLVVPGAEWDFPRVAPEYGALLAAWLRRNVPGAPS